MRSFGLAFTLWGGTILLCCGCIFLYGVITMDGLAVAAGIFGFFVAVFATCPLLVPTTLLIELAAKIPYNETVRLYWLGFTLVLQNYLFFQFLYLVNIFPGDEFSNTFFFISVAGMIIMLFVRKNAFKNFFSQQTTNKKV